jgi:hypothetical protein
MKILKESMKAFLDSNEKDWKIKGGIEVRNVLDFEKLLKGDENGADYNEMKKIVSGMSGRFSRIFVNLKTLEIQGYIYPFVVTASCSSIEPKAYFTVKTCSDLRIMGDFTNNFSILGAKIQEIAKFIKNVEG